MKVQVLLRKGFPTLFETVRVIGSDLKRGGGRALQLLAVEGDSEAFSFSLSLSMLVECPAFFASRYLLGI
jgi:hypothetical protein